MSKKTVFIVDDDAGVRNSLRMLLQSAGYDVIAFASAIEFLQADHAQGACLVTDIRMPKMSGLELQEELVKQGSTLPVIVITGHGDVPLAVRAMKAGAIDFIEKPFYDEVLLSSIAKALDVASHERNLTEEATAAARLIALLTPRELDVLEQLVAGRSNKVAAIELSISPRTVEIHRARIMDKLQARSLADLVRMAIAASVRQPTNVRPN